MRGLYKTDAYFQDLLVKSDSEATYYSDLVQKVCAQRGENDRGVQNGFNILLSIYEKRFRLLYTSGIRDEELKQTFLERLKYFSKTWEKEDSYFEVIDVLSLAIIMGIKADNENLSILIQKIDAADYQDFLVDTFIRQIDISWKKNCQSFLWGEEFEIYKTILNSSTERAVQLLITYLRNQWYELHEDCSWYDTHKSKNAAFFGYWSFDAGAIAKIMKLDDSKLINEQYYPYELVHMDFQ